MPTTIKLKNGSGAPLATDLVQGEVALDLTNKRIYSENAAGAVVEMGTSPSTIDINAGTIDGTIIGGASAAAGTFTTANATTVDTTNIEVTNVKAKDGTASATIADSTGVMTIASSVLTTTDINGGTIDGVTIGGASAGAGTFTTLQADTSLNVDGTVTADGLTLSNEGETITLGTSGTPDGRIKTGDAVFTNGLQIEADNGITLNSGQDDTANIAADNTAITRGSAYTKTALFDCNGDISFYEDTGTTPKLFWDSSAESLGIGTTTSNGKLTIKNPSVSGAQTILRIQGATNTSDLGGLSFNQSTDEFKLEAVTSSGFLTFGTGTGGSERLRITSAGNVGIGTTSPAVKLDVVGQVRASTGILFGSDTAAANALDDYEEGTWTPTYDGSVTNPTVTYSVTRSGQYTKIGNMVFCRGDLRTNAFTGGSGDVRIGGLPFTATNSPTSAGLGFLNVYLADGTSFAGDIPISGQSINNLTQASLSYRTTANGGSLALQMADLADGSSKNFIKFVIYYQV